MADDQTTTSRKPTTSSVWITVKLSVVLKDAIHAEASRAKYKSTFYNGVIEDYVRNWNARRVPRAYVGAAEGVNKTYYLSQKVMADVTAIADHDGVKKSWIIRTAFAWYLGGACACNDPWCTDELTSHPRPFPLPSEQPSCHTVEVTPDIQRIGKCA